MNTVQQVQQPTDEILRQIDTIIRELQALRRTILAQTQFPAENLAEQLYGALGHGSWEEYDSNLDWQRFEL